MKHYLCLNYLITYLSDFRDILKYRKKLRKRLEDGGLKAINILEKISITSIAFLWTSKTAEVIISINSGNKSVGLPPAVIQLNYVTKTTNIVSSKKYEF